MHAPSSIRRLFLSFLSLSLGLALGCSSPAEDAAIPVSGSAPAARVRTLTLGAYTTPREAYGKAIIPAFQKFWKEKTGEEVKFEESYLGSGAQSRAIAGGFEADVAALSLEADVDRIAKAGLITHDWKAGAAEGMVTRSVAVIAVRPGNPKGIKEWDDLARPGVEVLTPNVRTSGGAMWNIAAMYGAAIRGAAIRGAAIRGAAIRGGTNARKDDTAGADDLLRGVLKNVTIMDKGARESMVTFEKGVGDAAITYENEVLVGQKAGQKYEYVVPHSTLLIENPAAVVDTYVDKHGTRDLAEAFVKFLGATEAQRAFAEYGLRPVDAQVATEVASKFPTVTDLFTIKDLGGWPEVTRTLFAPGAAYDRATPNAEAAK